MDEEMRIPNRDSRDRGKGDAKILSLRIEFQQWLESLQGQAVKDPDGHARLTGKCGETIELFLKLEMDRVDKVGFLTNGCISSKICAALAAQMSLGKTPDEILEITGDSIMHALGDFPAAEEHCAFLAAETLQEAIHDYMIKERKNHPKGGSKP
jgi:nitrogen fixation NifU-like protein